MRLTNGQASTESSRMNKENGQGSGDMLDLSWLFRDR